MRTLEQMRLDSAKVSRRSIVVALHALDLAINSTLSGEARDFLTEANIALMRAEVLVNLDKTLNETLNEQDNFEHIHKGD